MNRKKKNFEKNQRAVGAYNEEIAAAYLRKQGLAVIERNYRVRTGEIDIIAKDGEYLVFCEVKYRSSKEAGGASYSISADKQRQVARVAKIYMAQKHISPETFCRFDCVLIDGKEIEYIKNAWQL